MKEMSMSLELQPPLDVNVREKNMGKVCVTIKQDIKPNFGWGNSLKECSRCFALHRRAPGPSVATHCP